MSLRHEQYAALKRSRDYLRRELTSDRPKTARQRRNDAYSCLRHFPFLHDNGQPIFSQDDFIVDYVVDCIGGNCPVQADGSIDGVDWYFRARHDSWQFAASEDPVQTVLDKDGFWMSGQWPDAGYMPLSDAKRIIEMCLQEFVVRRAVAK